MKTILNHVAFLVESIETAVKASSFPEELLGDIEEFPGEGTRELYIGGTNHMGRLLLMQAIGDGPYKRALDKRGPGLHHIALDVEDIDKFVSQLSGSGWSLHPKSLEFYKLHRQVYLCRTGTAVLLEIQEREIRPDGEYFIDRIEFPFEKNSLKEHLYCDRLIQGEIARVFKSGEQICQSLTI